jgi:hypothetical protein
MNTVIRCAFGAVLLALGSPVIAADKSPPLSDKQQATIRRACERRPATSMSGGPGIPPGRRFLAYDKDLGDCHKANRLETLQLLAKIVETGKPQEAVYALANMEALEGNLVMGALFADIPAESVDRTGADADLSQRITMKKRATELVEVAATPKMVPPTPPQP